MASSTARQFYEADVKAMPVAERLQLARLIMDDLVTVASRWVVEESDIWSEEDMRDLTRASLAYAARKLADRCLSAANPTAIRF